MLTCIIITLILQHNANMAYQAHFFLMQNLECELWSKFVTQLVYTIVLSKLIKIIIGLLLIDKI